MTDLYTIIDYIFTMFRGIWSVMVQYWFYSMPILIPVITMIISLIIHMQGKGGN